MKKGYRVTTAPLFLALLSVCVMISLSDAADAQKRSRTQSTKKKTSQTKSKQTKSKKVVPVASQPQPIQVKNGRAAARAPVLGKQEIQALLKRQRQGKLTATERQQLARYSAATRSRTSRAHAIQLARARVSQARSAALANIASANILKDNATGEDLEIRRVVIDALADRAGTVVVMDPSTGRVYTVVNQHMALGSPVKPCSTVKLIVGLAALHENVFDPNEDLPIARRTSLSLTDAIAHSNNTFFQVLGRRLGYQRVMQYAKDFGFGEQTGVNYPGESHGFLPEVGQEESGHMSSHGDGFGVTAIQLAAFTSAIANGGTLYVPHAPRTPEEADEFKPEVRRKIEMTPEDRLRMLTGMIGAVNFGTAKLAYDTSGQVAGKTGTCTGDSDKLGLFTSFDSINNPKLVVTVITTGPSEAGKRAAEIAGRIYRAISPRFLKDSIAAPITPSAEMPPKSAVSK